MKKIVKMVVAMVMAAAVFMAVPADVRADEAADAQLIAQLQAQQQLALLMQTPEYQAALAQLQAQQQAALGVWNNAQYLRNAAVNQTYILNAMMYMKNAQYAGMIQRQNLDYQNFLNEDLDDMKKAQLAAMQAYMGYYGL